MTQLETNTSPYLDSAFANDRAHVFHSWSAQGALNPTVIAGATSPFGDSRKHQLYPDHPRMRPPLSPTCLASPPAAGTTKAGHPLAPVPNAIRDPSGLNVLYAGFRRPRTMARRAWGG